MTTSFATYASQFLNRQRNPNAASLTSSQPLFFSFTTDEEGSHRGGHTRPNDDSDLDDIDDPHLRASDIAPMASMSTTRRPDADDEDDPYLRLDEDDPGSQYPSHSIPLLASSHAQSEAEPSRGWLAHQPTQLRSPSPSSSESSGTRPKGPSPPIHLSHSPPPLPPPPISLSLTESLLPRDGHSRPLDLFSLPDPRHRVRRKHHDPIWTSIWLGCLSICLFSALLILFLTRQPPDRPRRGQLPYLTLLHTVPLLVILTFVSAAVSYAHILLLRIFVKPVVIGTTIFVPATLLISAVWAFVGSFMWDGDKEPTWGETWGLRLFSLIPLGLALLTGRRLLTLPQKVHTTSSLLTMTTQLLSTHPLLLVLSPSVLLVSLVLSIPFLTLAFRLLLIGYATHPKGGWEWHVHGWANWAIAGTVGVWIWSWAVARGVLRSSTASVIASWYFSDPTAPIPPPMSTHTLHAAIHRATGPSLGSIALAGLLLTLTQLLLLLTVFLRRLPNYLPLPMRLYTGPLVYAAGYLEGAAGSLSRYALVYVGVTGEGFWVSARRARALTSAVESNTGRYRKRFSSEPPLTMLTIAPLSLTLPFALSTYLFVAHTLGAPDQALEASILAGGVTALVGLFCVGLVKDTADTLYLCYCIDKDAGERRRAEVFEMFEYDSRKSPQQRRGQPAQRQQPRQPPPPTRRESGAAQGQRSQPQQPISKRVEGMVSPDSSPEFAGRDVSVEGRAEPETVRWDAHAQATREAPREEVETGEVDPFLADLQDEVVGPSRGYTVTVEDDDSGGSLSDERDGRPPKSLSGSAPRVARDEEEGLGSAFGSGLFPGSDIF